MKCYRCKKEIQNESYLHLEDPTKPMLKFDLCVDCATTELNKALERITAFSPTKLLRKILGEYV